MSDTPQNDPQRPRIIDFPKVRAVWLLWTAIIGGVLTLIGQIETLGILSGAIRWLAEFWRDLYQAPIAYLSGLIGIHIPPYLADFAVLTFFTISIGAITRRIINIAWLAEIDREEDDIDPPAKHWEVYAQAIAYSPQTASASFLQRYLAALVVYSPLAAIAALIFPHVIDADSPSFISSAGVITGWLVVCASSALRFTHKPGFGDDEIDERVWETQRVFFRSKLVAYARLRVGLYFWACFLGLFLIGAYPWIADMLGQFQAYVEGHS